MLQRVGALALLRLQSYAEHLEWRARAVAGVLLQRTGTMCPAAEASVEPRARGVGDAQCVICAGRDEACTACPARCACPGRCRVHDLEGVGQLQPVGVETALDGTVTVTDVALLWSGWGFTPRRQQAAAWGVERHRDECGRHHEVGVCLMAQDSLSDAEAAWVYCWPLYETRSGTSKGAPATDVAGAVHLTPASPSCEASTETPSNSQRRSYAQ